MKMNSYIKFSYFHGILLQQTTEFNRYSFNGTERERERERERDAETSAMFLICFLQEKQLTLKIKWSIHLHFPCLYTGQLGN